MMDDEGVMGFLTKSLPCVHLGTSLPAEGSSLNPEDDRFLAQLWSEAIAGRKTRNRLVRLVLW